MKLLLLSFLAFMLAAPVAVHASPDDPLCSVLDIGDAAATFVQTLATWSPAVSTGTPSASADPSAITPKATASPVQEVAALSRSSKRTAKAPVVLAYEHCFASGGDNYVSPGIGQVWRPPALQRE